MTHTANKTEGLCPRGLVEEETIGKANYTLEYNTAAKDSAVVLCGLYSEQQLRGALFSPGLQLCFVKAAEVQR